MRLIRSLLPLLASLPAVAADFPAPPPPADFTLVKWPAVVDYFRKADAASDRVVVRELGTTTEGRPYLAAFVSSPDTILSLDRYRDMQRRLADPPAVADPEGDAKLVAESKAVVLITCSIHSTEAASTFMAMKLLHELATKDDAATREVLDNTILILVPSCNPDGVDIVADWYEQTRDRPWEGEGLSRLYHKYAGHDTNRDWFMLNLQETRLLTRLLYKEWFPTLAYDVHQMGSKGARMFVPPFFDPINPNLDPRIHQSIAAVGAHMAGDLAAEKKKGVLTHAMYDNWWNGGNRTTPQRHNIVAVLTEAASAKLASPIFLDRDELRGFTRGFSGHKPAVNFVDPWEGGWWRLADIESYERICAHSLLTLAAKYKDRFQRDYLAMGRDAIRKGQFEPPYAWIVPADQRDPGTAAAMVRILGDTGVKLHQARSTIEADGRSYPAGSWVLLASQPYRAHLKDMMERQEYPTRLLPSGEAEPPYDVAGWTLPLQMGVRSVVANRPIKGEVMPVDRVEMPAGGIDGRAEQAATFVLENRSNDDFLLLNALWDAGVEVRITTAPVDFADERRAFGTIYFLADARSRGVLSKTLPAICSRVKAVADEPFALNKASVALPRRKIGVYQPWMPSMDEGWTRLVLEKFHFPYATLHNADIRAGGLKDRIDVLLIPSIEPRNLRDGFAAKDSAPEFTGGLGREGSEAIGKFVESGGTLVCLEDSCAYAIDALALPVANAVQGVPTSAFYGPGSIVRVEHDGKNRLTLGMPAEGSAYFDRSLAFETKGSAKWDAATTYASSYVLESGWLLGAEKIQGRAALVEIPRGSGGVILFAFPPQHRGQPHGTFRLLFNSLILGRDVHSR